MSALSYAGFGFLARVYALGIQKRNIFDSTLHSGCCDRERLTHADFSGHIAFMAGFGALGYWLHGVKKNQEQLLEKKREELLEHRKA